MATRDEARPGPVSLSEWRRYVQRETRRILEKQQAEHVNDAAGPNIDVESGALLPPEARHQHDVEPDAAAPPVRARRSTPSSVIIRRTPAPVEEEADDLELDELAQFPSDVQPLTPEELAQLTSTNHVAELAEVAVVERAPKAKPEQVSLFDTANLERREEEQRRAVKPTAKQKREELIEDLLDPVISLEQAATILNVCRTTVRRYTNQGLLECIRTPGNQRRFKLSTILSFVESKDVQGIGKRGRKPGKSKSLGEF